MSDLTYKQAVEGFDTDSDVGAVYIPGSVEYDPANAAYIMAGAGTNIWGDHDNFHFMWKRMHGNFILTMRAEFVGSGVNPHRKLGWMARTGLESNSPQICTGIHGDGLLSLQFRRTPRAQTEEVKAALFSADVIQLERNGNTYIMSVAQYGEPFTTVQVADLDLGDDLYVGLFVCSHEDHVLEKAVFRDVRIVVPVKAGFERSRDPFGSRPGTVGDCKRPTSDPV